MDIEEVVVKLIGPIDPVGETNSDEKRYENLKEMTGLVTALVERIKYVTRSQISHEFSVKRAGDRASEYLGNLWFEITPDETG